MGLSMRIKRLLEMSPQEVAFRGRQRMATLQHRVASPGGVAHPVCRLDRRPGGMAGDERSQDSDESEYLFSRFAVTADERFFPGAVDPDLELSLAAICPSRKDRVISDAEAVLENRFQVLGYGPLDFGNPVNWHLDPVSGIESPARHGSAIDYLDPAQVGDSKVVWELNRHQWALDLAQAWRITGDARYVDGFFNLLRSWMKHNPCGFGINWTSALEAAFRLISWSWALVLFRGAAALTPARYVEVLGWIDAHARFIERNLSKYFSPNTHLTGEGLGLLYAGILFNDLERASAWTRTGQRILVEELERQVQTDGVYFEHSTRYQSYTVEIYLHFAILAARNDLALPDSVHTAIGRMVEFLLQLPLALA